MSANPHASWAEVYDLVYEQSFGRVYAELTETTVREIEERIQPPAEIVDYGAGTGRLSVPLAATGFNVTAVEPCPEMLKQLKLKSGTDSIRCVCSKMEDFTGDGKFDVALCVFTVLVYLLDEESLKKSLRAAHNSLKPGGILFIDIPSEFLFEGYSQNNDLVELVVLFKFD